ncbi:hypothetical protein KFK09_003647 [Dendrobium nobile]|uniref:Uncharacterized protein n=1 Tax=Dendrobium nobile TaxID=94219 RepID=A0A8T3C3R8_DENNO|nr:hypothetical protein KFK09_003647 [Dendrobium nobile]
MNNEVMFHNFTYIMFQSYFNLEGLRAFYRFVLSFLYIHCILKAYKLIGMFKYIFE